MKLLEQYEIACAVRRLAPRTVPGNVGDDKFLALRVGVQQSQRMFARELPAGARAAIHGGLRDSKISRAEIRLLSAPLAAAEQERLVSRFEWGMVADVAPPDLEHRIAILRQKSRADRLEQAFPDDVLEFVAAHVQANVRELEGSIIKLLAYASLRNRPVSLELARDAMRDKVRSYESRPSKTSRHDRLRTIQQRVATEWGVSIEGLQAKSRTRTVTVPRQVAMYLSRELLGLQLVEIGNAFGGRDHSTVIHSLDRVSAMLGNSMEFRARVEKLRDSLRNDA